MLILLLLLFGLLNQTYSLMDPFTFSFPSFDSSSCGSGSNLICMGSVTVSNGSLCLTPDPKQQLAVKSSSFMVGRVLYKHPVLAWPAFFSTTFTISILPEPDSVGGDGMSFIMAQDDKPSPPESFGSFIGILDPSTQGGALSQLAVELDTYKNEEEPDGNHVAIDTTSVLVPVTVKSLNSSGIDFWFNLCSSILILLPFSVCNIGCGLCLNSFFLNVFYMGTIVEDLQNNLKESSTALEKAVEERVIYQSKVCKLEADLEAFEILCNDMRHKLGEHQEQESKWQERETELMSLYNHFYTRPTTSFHLNLLLRVLSTLPNAKGWCMLG